MLSINSSNCSVLVAPTEILHANGIIIGFIKFSTSVNAFLCTLIGSLNLGYQLIYLSLILHGK